jgi:hypothetical protein
MTAIWDIFEMETHTRAARLIVGTCYVRYADFEKSVVPYPSRRGVL